MNDQTNESKHVLISGGSRGLGQVLVQGMMEVRKRMGPSVRK